MSAVLFLVYFHPSLIAVLAKRPVSRPQDRRFDSASSSPPPPPPPPPPPLPNSTLPTAPFNPISTFMDEIWDEAFQNPYYFSLSFGFYLKLLYLSLQNWAANGSYQKNSTSSLDNGDQISSVWPYYLSFSNLSRPVWMTNFNRLAFLFTVWKLPLGRIVSFSVGRGGGGLQYREHTLPGKLNRLFNGN